MEALAKHPGVPKTITITLDFYYISTLLCNVQRGNLLRPSCLSLVNLGGLQPVVILMEIH